MLMTLLAIPGSCLGCFGVAFTFLEPKLKNTAAAMITATIPPADAPTMMPMLELAAGVSGGGVVSWLLLMLVVSINNVESGLGEDTGDGVVTGFGVVNGFGVVDGLGVDIGAVELLVGATATIVTVGWDTVVVVPTAFAVSCVFNAASTV